MADSKELVLEAMKKAGKPLKTAEIVELCGLPKKEVDKAVKTLQKEGGIGSPKRCYYEPAEPE